MQPRRVRLSLHPHIAQEVYMQQDLIQLSAIPYAALLLLFFPALLLLLLSLVLRTLF